MDDNSQNGQQRSTHSPYATVHHWRLPHGVAVAVAIPKLLEPVPEEVLARLHPIERALAAGQPPRRRVTWIGGRIALREALAAFEVEPGPLLATDRGAPILPEGLAGSVTHKAGAFAVALVHESATWRIGVDLELPTPARPGIARKVLTPRERACLEGCEPAAYWREVLVRFSVKEAIYKALDPFVRRYVDFAEVSVDLLPDGITHATLDLKHGEGPFQVEARTFFPENGEIVTTARVRPGPLGGLYSH